MVNSKNIHSIRWWFRRYSLTYIHIKNLYAYNIYEFNAEKCAEQPLPNAALLDP
jgi:hypothetical protein